MRPFLELRMIFLWFEILIQSPIAFALWLIIGCNNFSEDLLDLVFASINLYSEVINKMNIKSKFIDAIDEKKEQRVWIIWCNLDEKLLVVIIGFRFGIFAILSIVIGTCSPNKYVPSWYGCFLCNSFRWIPEDSHRLTCVGRGIL